MHASIHKYGKSLIFINSLVLALLCKYMLYYLLVHINLKCFHNFHYVKIFHIFSKINHRHTVYLVSDKTIEQKPSYNTF